MDAKVETGLGGYSIKFKYITSEGDVKTSKVAGSFILYNNDGSIICRSTDNGNYGLYSIAGGSITSVNPMLFKYDLNSLNKINRIYLPTDGTGTYGVFTLEKSYVSKAYSSLHNRIGSTYLGDDTVVISASGSGSENPVFVTTPLMFFDEGDTYTLEVFDLNSEEYPTVVVV